MITSEPSVAESAKAAANAVLGQAAAPTSQCCTVGTAAFAESEVFLAAEVNVALGEIAGAQQSLLSQAETNQAMWTSAEQQIQVRGVNDPSGFPGWVSNFLLAETKATGSAFSAAEASLAAELTNVQAALGLAENFLQAEATWFNTAGCQAAAPEPNVATAEPAKPAGSVSHLVDKTHAALPSKDLLSAPVSAIRGVSKNDGDALKKSLNVETIGDLAKHPAFLAAEQILSHSKQ